MTLPMTEAEMLDQHDAMFEVTAPVITPGTITVRAGDLNTALRRLTKFPTTGKNAPAACHYLWLYAESRRLIGLATDLAATGQVDLPLMAGGDLPLFGITAGAAERLRKPLAKVASVVTIGVADTTVTLHAAGEQIAAQSLHLPNPIDLGVLAEIGDKLDRARAAAEASELPHGTTRINPTLQSRFAEADRDVQIWYAATGSCWVEVDPHFRGHIHAARPTPAGARRPLPTRQPHPAIPRSAA